MTAITHDISKRTYVNTETQTTPHLITTATQTNVIFKNQHKQVKTSYRALATNGNREKQTTPTQHNILILADSHGRGLSHKLQKKYP